jgi:hypothetical protein
MFANEEKSVGVDKYKQANLLASVQTFSERNLNFKNNGVLGVWFLTSAGDAFSRVHCASLSCIEIDIYIWFVWGRRSVVG